MSTYPRSPKPYANYTRWSVADVATLRELAPRLTCREIAARLGRPLNRVRARANDLGIRFRQPGKPSNVRHGRNHIEALRRPTVRDLEWAAGFLEGEGSFRRQRTGSERLHAPQVEREPLERLIALFGGRLYRRSNQSARDRGGRDRDVWVWDVCGVRARGVMLTLYALLSTKRRRQIAGALDVTFA